MNAYCSWAFYGAFEGMKVFYKDTIKFNAG